MIKDKWTLLLLTIGIISLAMSVYFFISTSNFIENSGITTGKVISIKEVRRIGAKGASSTIYNPVIQFSNREGVSYTFMAEGSSFDNYSVNQNVPVMYDPNNPARVRIIKFFNMWAEVAIFLAIAIICLFTAFVRYKWPQCIPQEK